MEPTQPARGPGLARRTAPLALTALVAAAVGATAYALGTSSNPDHRAAPAATVTRTVVQQSSAVRTSASTTLADIYRRVSPGVVDINVIGTTSGGVFGGRQQTGAEGTGWELDDKGDIVTNQHVVDGATSISVTFSSGGTARAKLIGADSSTDTAVIRVSVPTGKLNPLQVGDESSLSPGDTVIALGSPFGLVGSVSAGIVSGLHRKIQAPNGYTIAGAIQTDAAINHGNSGGPLVDASGAVVGMDAQIDSESGGNEGVGFAIPISTVHRIAEELIGGGHVRHAYLGVEASNDPSGQGARIEVVHSNTPASAAGLKVGDVIISVDGDTIASSDDLVGAIESRHTGDKVKLGVLRAGATVDIEATLGHAPS